MTSSASKDRATWLEGPSAICSEPPAATRPWRLILLGAPGVGKGTQADLLHQHLRACHLSTGDLFRAAASHDGCKLSPAMVIALGFMSRGALVPDYTVWEMVHERSSCLRCRGGFILDCFPRTLMQAESLQRLLKAEKLHLDSVVNYELPFDAIVERLSGRRTCEKCKAVYQLVRQPSKNGSVCDRCDGHLYQRDDDRPEAITVRMKNYEHCTEPLIHFYTDQGLLLPIAATGSPNEICTRTIAALQQAPTQPRP